MIFGKLDINGLHAKVNKKIDAPRVKPFTGNLAGYVGWKQKHKNWA